MTLSPSQSQNPFPTSTTSYPTHKTQKTGWHPLVPSLPPPRTEQNGTRVISLLAIQVTVFPNSGFSICLTLNHLAAEGKSFYQFVKYWASLCKSKENFSLFDASLSLPSHEREKAKDPKGLRPIYLRKLQDSVSESMEFAGLVRDVCANKVRTTIQLRREQVEKLKKLIFAAHASKTLLHVSTFVVTSSFVWVSMIKSEQSKTKDRDDDDDEICYLVYLADCLDHPQLSIPSNYFGNCLASLVGGVKRGELVGKFGMVVAANAIERKIRDFKVDALRGAETLMSDYKELGKPDKSLVIVAGSPKFEVYEIDFGWGKPMKSDSVHIDSTGSITLSDCRVRDGGIEVGLALERNRMIDFINISKEQLGNICRAKI